jgi:transposase
MILRAYKTEITVNNKQQTLLSSKTCSCCGWKNSDLTLTDRVFECKVCDMKLDIDVNASLNLKQIYMGRSLEIQACGDGSSSLSETTSVSPFAKQEFNKKSRVYILKR